MKYWHYTIKEYIDDIFKDRKIKLAREGIESGEKPVVWFSTNPYFEETARKAVRDKLTGEWEYNLSRDEMFKRGVISVRIEVDPTTISFYNFNEFKKFSNISSSTSKALEKKASEVNANPEEWYVSFKSVPAFSFKSLDVWNGNDWVTEWTKPTK